MPGRRLLRVVVLPLVVPQFVLGYSWTQAYGRAGFTDSLLGIHWDGLIGPAGIVVVLVVNTAPLSYLLAAAGLVTRAQPELEHAARASGATQWAALRTVTLPLLRPALAAAGVLTFVATLESFAVPQVLGTGRILHLDDAHLRRPGTRQRSGPVHRRGHAGAGPGADRRRRTRSRPIWCWPRGFEPSAAANLPEPQCRLGGRPGRG